MQEGMLYHSKILRVIPKVVVVYEIYKIILFISNIQSQIFTLYKF